MARILAFPGSVASGGSSNSFSTVQTPFGTSPVASSPTDTLTFTSTDGSVVITGNSGTDTIDFSVTMGSGDVVGPASSTDNAITRFDGTTGKLIQNSLATVDDSGNISANNFSGSSSGSNTGDVTLGTANGLSLVGQALSLVLSGALTTGALSSTDWNTFNSKQAALVFGNLTDVGTDGIVVTGGTGAVIGSGTSIAQHVADSTHNGYLSSTDWSTFNGKQAAGNYITALTGDVTASGPGSSAATLATVNANVGTFGSSTSIPTFTVNAKGLITAASENVVIAPAGTLSGTTLNATVVSSSLTSVGTITSGTWTGTTIAVANGGTSLTTLTANNVILGNGSSAPTFVAPGTSGNVLTSNGTTWTSAAAAGGGAPVGASYFVVALDATLTNERALSFNATNFSTTDLGAGNTYSVNTSQNIDVTASPTFIAPTVQRLIISGSTSSNFINATGTLDNATGDETAYQLNYVTNKLTSGIDTGLYINQTDTSSPGISYLINMCRNASSVFNIENNGNLATSATVWTLATLTSFTMQNILAQPLLYADASSFKIKTNPVYIEMAAATSGTPAPSLTTTCPAHTGMTAATEMVEMLIDMSSVKQWTAGAAIPAQRSLKILAPSYTTTAASTITEACTIYISGPPAISGFSAQITTSIGFKLDTRVLSTGVNTGIGFQVYAPTGALTNACGSFMGGNVGINSLSPKTWLDIRVTGITDTNNVVTCLDGTARYIGTYIGGTAITSAPASNTSVFLMDFGWAPTANSAFIVGTNQSFFTLQGSVNTTGNVRGVANTMFLDTTSPATATQFNGFISAVQSTAASSGNITTARNYQSSANYAGTGTITTHVAYDCALIYTNVAGTATTTIGVRIGNVSKGAAYTLTNFYGVRIEDQTAAFGTDLLGFYQLGTNLKNRLVGDTAIGVDANPGATLDVAGKFYVAGATGLITKYNNIATVSGGVPSILGTADLTAQTAAKAATTLYTPTATGKFRISCALKVTTAATTSSTLGAVTITYTSGDGSVAQSQVMAMATSAGAIATTSTTNSTTTSTLSGELIIYAVTGVAIQYAIAYVSSGATPMAYSAHLKCEAM